VPVSSTIFKKGHPVRIPEFGLAFVCIGLIWPMNAATGQNGINQGSRGDCSPNVNAQGNVTIVCPNNSPGIAGPPPQRSSPGGPGGRWRNGEFIPTCPVGMGYSLQYKVCIPAQQIGGDIPCGPGDQYFDSRRGDWVSNCR
jgi:hypothetical protein